MFSLRNNEKQIMFCNEVKQLLALYLHGELARSERALLAMHLTQCRACQRELDAIANAESVISSSLKAHANSVAPSKQAWLRLQTAITDGSPCRSFSKAALDAFAFGLSRVASSALPLLALFVVAGAIVVSVLADSRVSSDQVIDIRAASASKPLSIQHLAPPPDPDVNLFSSFFSQMSGEIDEASPIQPCAACIRFR
jgi:anti-sigma factor RsiW